MTYTHAIPEVCPACAYPTTLLNVTRLSPRRNAIGCHVCGRVLAIEVRHVASPEPHRCRPESPQAAETVPSAPIPPAAAVRPLWDRLGDFAVTDESWRGSLAATGPRRPFGELIAERAVAVGMPPEGFLKFVRRRYTPRGTIWA